MNNSEENRKIRFQNTLSPEQLKILDEQLQNLGRASLIIIEPSEIFNLIDFYRPKYLRRSFSLPQKPQWRTRIHGQMIQRIARSHMSSAMVREMNADPAYKRFTRSKYQLNEEGD